MFLIVCGKKIKTTLKMANISVYYQRKINGSKLIFASASAIVLVLLKS